MQQPRRHQQQNQQGQRGFDQQRRGKIYPRSVRADMSKKKCGHTGDVGEQLGKAKQIPLRKQTPGCEFLNELWFPPTRQTLCQLRDAGGDDETSRSRRIAERIEAPQDRVAEKEN